MAINLLLLLIVIQVVWPIKTKHTKNCIFTTIENYWVNYLKNVTKFIQKRVIPWKFTGNMGDLITNSSHIKDRKEKFYFIAILAYQLK